MNVIAQAVSLDDKYACEEGRVFLSGIQALVRLPLDQIRADRAAGLNTAGYISGYRGSPLGTYDLQLTRAKSFLDSHNILFQPGINEEMAAGAIWGTQKVGLRPGARQDGVFGIWYGKAPGIDRCGDIFRHANMTGTARHGGVLAVCGDDQLAKSTSLPSNSEPAFVDWEMPILSPADVQEVLDYGLYGLALSRYAGTWTALMAMTEAMDASGIVSVDPDRFAMRLPDDYPDPRESHDLNRLLEPQLRWDTEILMRTVRLPAAQAFVRANGLDGVRFGAGKPRFGIVTTGKAWPDLMQTFQLIGLDEDQAKKIGLGVYKVAMPWPLEPERMRQFASGLERLLVVENKRPLMEAQLKEQFYHWQASERPPIWGKQDGERQALLPSWGDLGPMQLGPALKRFLPDGALATASVERIERMSERIEWAQKNCATAKRSPFFCSGCPHNTGTRQNEGVRGFSGVGCHLMSDLVGRTTEGGTPMGFEGVPWYGQFPFTDAKHIFANIGDGTYFHSGLLAIRAALAVKAPITFKLLYNDAVAMTGGQPVEGPMSVARITRQLEGEGVTKIVVVGEDDPVRGQPHADYSPITEFRPRRHILAVQKELSEIPGVTVMIFDQTCATEKRRRRKRGAYPDPDKRLYIHPRVCEGCGDCSVQSNCISVEPLETPFGDKRRINQATCNKDYSCAEGFCPSFVVVHGGKIPASSHSVDIDGLAAKLKDPAARYANQPHDILFAGVGGTGVTTVSAILAMAAHIDGRNAATMDIAGLAQMGGPVTSHIRLAPSGFEIAGPRIPVAGLDVLLCGDLVVGADSASLQFTDGKRTRAVINTRVAPTAEFPLRQTQSFTEDGLVKIVRSATSDSWQADFTGLAMRLFGSAIYANLMLVGMACQKGLIPISPDAIERAIELNRVSVEQNLKAFRAGRVAAENPDALGVNALPPRLPEMALDERIAFLANELQAYQNRAYADAFTEFVEKVRRAEAGIGGERLTRSVADGLYKLMAYKDEYEVARLYAAPSFRQKLSKQLEGATRIEVQMAPPFWARRDPVTGRPRKTTFGPWVLPLFAVMARLKGVRGTLLDPFAHTAERREERALIGDYRAMILKLLEGLTTGNLDLAVQIAATADKIRGYGPVKVEKLAAVRAEQAGLLAQWDEARASGRPVAAAAE